MYCKYWKDRLGQDSFNCSLYRGFLYGVLNMECPLLEVLLIIIILYAP